MSSGWFNLSETARTTPNWCSTPLNQLEPLFEWGNWVLQGSLTWVRGGSTYLKQLEPPRTDVLPLWISSNHCLNEETGFYRVVWHEFRVVQPLRTSLNHRMTDGTGGVQGSLTWIRGGSTSSNHLEPPFDRHNWVYKVKLYLVHPVPSVKWRFEQVRKSSTTLN